MWSAVEPHTFEILSDAPAARPHRLRTRFNAVLALVALWHQRARERRDLARMTVYDLKDIGLTASDAEFLASKPFWRP
ncbi:MAG: DUF1127 domain-containing protein [Proteobacteria bacterium]|nr:DUF1127 domain-containing protein [Pseudomonadota bacterium]